MKVTNAQAVVRIRSWVGSNTIPPDNISALHHCIGIARRLFTNLTGKSYATANDAARAVGAAGHLKSGQPPAGSLRWWLSADAGHVATQDNDDDYVVCNVGTRVQRVKASVYDNLRYVGWSYSWEVPGWGKMTDAYPAGGGGGTSAPPPRPKPKSGRTTIVRGTYARERPDKNSPKVGKMKQVGKPLDYVSVHPATVKGTNTFLETPQGNWVLAYKTARGA